MEFYAMTDATFSLLLTYSNEVLIKDLVPFHWPLHNRVEFMQVLLTSYEEKII